MANVIPRPQSVDLVRASLQPSDLVLVTGGSGWLGRTTLALLWHAFGRSWVVSNVKATASWSRPINVLGCGEVAVDDQLAGFEPTIVVNCSFPTRDRVAELGYSQYVRAARALTERLLELSRSPAVRKVVTFSSGAAVPSETYPADIEVNPYGVLKASEETLLSELAATLALQASICRVWAISGPHVQEPGKYAFSDFVLQAVSKGRITVNSTRPVVRQYASADDVVALALASSGAFDSGGVTVEMGELASAVAAVTGAIIERSSFDPNASADEYRGDDAKWKQRLHAFALQPADLEEQIKSVVEGLRP